MTRPSNETSETSAQGIFDGPGEMRARCRAIGWAMTSLGPVGQWAPALRAAVRLALDSGIAMGVYAGPEYLFVYNDGFGRLLGEARHRWALDRPAREVWPEIWEHLAPEFAQVLAGGPPVHRDDERFLLDRAGHLEESFWTYTLSPVRADDGAVVGIHHVSTETTGRVRVEAALRASEARQAFLLTLSDALRDLHDPVAVQGAAVGALGERLGADRTYYVEVDEARAEFVVEREWHRSGTPSHARRYPLDAWSMPWLLDGQPWVVADVNRDPAMPDDQRAAYRGNDIGACVVVPLVKGGRLVATLVANQRAPRGWTPVEVALVEEVAQRTWAAVERARAVGALHANEAYFQAQKLVEDERARLLAREQEARREAERAMVLRDEFLGVVSHELRTPLSAILLWSKMLLAGAVPPAQQQRALASIDASASAQKRLIEDLLDVSSMLSGKVKLSLREVSLGPVVEAAVTAVQPTAEAKGIRIDVDLEAGPPWARVDPERLQQVVWNILTNAVKFTPAGGRVTVRLRASEQVVRLEVEDTGQGITPEFLPHVFERFRQQNASITRTHGGLGLGLAIARQLVELHGGTIGVTSAGEGQGATFTVELPRLEVEAPAGEAPASEAARATPSPGSRLDATLASTHVLLVEDEDETREGIHWLLEAQGAQVTAVASADEALAAFDKSASGCARPFDVLVSDIGLPDLDGYALLAALRQRPLGATLPALALTAYARGEDRERALAAGFEAYLAKPVEPKPLLATVATLARATR